MNQQTHLIKARETWLKVYQDLGSVAKAARRCGIARSTLYRWIERFEQEGKEGLKDKSKKPHRLARLKVTQEQEQLILQIRKQYSYGQKRSAHICGATIRSSFLLPLSGVFCRNIR
jgi:transposase-like protein